VLRSSSHHCDLNPAEVIQNFIKQTISASNVSSRAPTRIFERTSTEEFGYNKAGRELVTT
jgi:hypothetical protein